jgi:F-type H+-transporting ATPase subunit j
MAFMGLKAYPTPIWKPLGPFIIASVITFFGVNAMQNAMVKAPDAAKDPRNPYGESQDRATVLLTAGIALWEERG